MTTPTPHVTIRPSDDKIVEVWYEIEASLKNADDWYATSAGSSDSLASAKGKLDDVIRKDKARKLADLYEYRIVRKTVTTEPIEIDSEARHSAFNCQVCGTTLCGKEAG